MKRFLFLLLLAGCGDSGELAAMKASFEAAKETVVDEAKATTKSTADAVVILKENTAALARIESKLEASLVNSKSARKEDDQQSALESPAKANTAATPVQVATPGTSQSESLVELASRLYDRGVNVHNRTEDELKAIDAQMVGTKSAPVQYQSRPTYSVQSGCPGGVCPVPQRVSRRGRR